MNAGLAFGKAMVSRLFVRVPAAEWSEVSRGMKREWRMAPANSPNLDMVELPTPVILFKAGKGQVRESKIAVVTSSWVEPLGAISKESLVEERVDSLPEFKARWCATREPRFNPLKQVRVIRSRSWQEGDEEEFALRIFRHLYPDRLR